MPTMRQANTTVVKIKAEPTKTAEFRARGLGAETAWDFIGALSPLTKHLPFSDVLVRHEQALIDLRDWVPSVGRALP